MRQPRSDAPSVVLPIIDGETGGVNARTLEEHRKFGGNSRELFVPRVTRTDHCRAVQEGAIHPLGRLPRRCPPAPPRARQSISSERGEEGVRTIETGRFER